MIPIRTITDVKSLRILSNVRGKNVVQVEFRDGKAMTFNVERDATFAEIGAHLDDYLEGGDV